MAAKKIKLQVEGISEILVADTDSEPGAEGSDVEGDSEEEEQQQQQQQQQQASIGVKPQAATSGSKEYEKQWKLHTVSDTLNEAYAKFCNPLENLAVDEVIVKFMGRVIFRQ